VRVEARAVVHRGEDPAAVQARVLGRLYQSINPLPSIPDGSAWPFGQPLRVSHVFDIMLAEPGVSFVDRVKLMVDEVPKENVQCLGADPSQPDTWYASTGPVAVSLDGRRRWLGTDQRIC